MKKLILSLLLLMNLTGLSFAGMYQAVSIPLKDTNGVLISNYSLTSGVAVTSQTLTVLDNVGFATLLIAENQAGGTGDVDIYTEYSLDGTNWYRAYTTDMAGSLTAEGNIVTTLQNVTRWIPFTPRLAPYMHFVFDPDANSKITATLVYQRDR